MTRNPISKDFVGKTIEQVSITCNYIEFKFTDGTKVGLEVMHAGHDIYGMFVEDGGFGDYVT